MAVIRQQNLLGQQRIDVPHLRSIESGAAGDFDLLAGQIMGGKQALVVKGFNLITTGAGGRQASTLQINVSGGIVIHHEASESGSIFFVPLDRDPETLSSTNSNVTGSFTANQVNYIGLDLIRSADSSTSDLVKFMDASTDLETPKTVPLARTLNYRFVISTEDFSSNPNVLPIAKVTTDANNNVATNGDGAIIEDARNLMFRLGQGGDAPNNQYAFPWAGTRYENLTDNVFAGGDKGIDSLKSWMDSIMTRLWEVGGGEYWYSATSDRDTKLVFGPDVLVSNNDNFEWTLGSETLEWSDVSIVFANSTGYVNEVADDSAVIEDGQCLYVDLDRTQNLTGGSALVAQVADMTTLGAPTVPGSRYIIAWRIGDDIHVREKAFEVGRALPVATTTGLGIVLLSRADFTDADNPVVIGRAGGTIVAPAGNSTGLTITGTGTASGVLSTGGSTAATNWATRRQGAGLVGLSGAAASAGLVGEAIGVLPGSRSTTLFGTGVLGVGDAAGIGVVGIGGGSNGNYGVWGQGSVGTNGGGIGGQASGEGYGVTGYGAHANGFGGYFTNTAASGQALYALGAASTGLAAGTGGATASAFLGGIGAAGDSSDIFALINGGNGGNGSNNFGAAGGVGGSGPAAASVGGFGGIGGYGEGGTGGTGGTNTFSGTGVAGGGGGTGLYGRGGVGGAPGPSATGGAGGPGVYGLGGAGTSGGANGPGGRFAAATAATDTVRQTAVKIDNGDLDMDGVVNPASDEPMLNKLTPSNICKAWGLVFSGATGGVSAGFNIASATTPGDELVVTLAEPLDSSLYSVNVTIEQIALANAAHVRVSRTSTSAFNIILRDSAGTKIDLNANTVTFAITVFGLQ